MRGSTVNPKTLIEAAIRARSYIQPLRESRTGCSFTWNSLPQPKTNPPSHSAVDGGSRRIDTEARTIFAVKAWGALFNNGIAREESAAYVGSVIPPRHIEERIGMYREILEAHTALSIVPDGGILLMDGSIRPVISWWIPVFTRRRGKLYKSISEAEKSITKILRGSIDKLEDYLKECLEERLGGPTCIEVILKGSPIRPGSAEMAHRHWKAINEESSEWIILLEVAEKLYLYKKLLETAWGRGTLPVFITKTSRQNNLCGGVNPDVHYIIRAEPRREGYTLWDKSLGIGLYEIAGINRGDASASDFYPDIAGIRGFYEDRIALVEFYARLKRGGPVLLVGVVLPSEKVERDPLYANDIARDVLASLQSIPGDGYPAPLFIAHHKAKITQGEVDSVKGILGLDAEAPGRYVLEF